MHLDNFKLYLPPDEDPWSQYIAEFIWNFEAVYIYNELKATSRQYFDVNYAHTASAAEHYKPKI